MFFKKPSLVAGTICVIGGAGTLGQSLLSFMELNDQWTFVFFVEKAIHACALEASFQDHLVKNCTISFNRSSITEADTVVFLAGAKTSPSGSKNDLYHTNKLILSDYLPLLAGKKIILATNPCTQLGMYIESQIDAFTISVGVNNDFNRASYCDPSIDYILGAHNANEQTYYDSSGEIVFDGFNDSENHYKHKLLQDQLVQKNNYATLHQELLKAEHLRWWKLQRYHSTTNASAYSCAKSIVEVLKYLSGVSTFKVHGEVKVSLQTGESLFIGLPLIGEAPYCTEETVNSFIMQRRGYYEKYRI